MQQYNQLEILEGKINKTIQLIDKLQAENNELKRYNAELINKVQEQEKINQKLRKGYHKLKEQQNNSHFTLEKEEEIKQKVEGMLAKLDNLQHISSL